MGVDPIVSRLHSGITAPVMCGYFNRTRRLEAWRERNGGVTRSRPRCILFHGTGPYSGRLRARAGVLFLAGRAERLPKGAHAHVMLPLGERPAAIRLAARQRRAVPTDPE